MAIIYLAPGGSDGNSGLTWALAKGTLAAAISAAGSGGTVYVAHDYTESMTSTNVTLTLGTGSGNGAYRKVIAVDRTGSPEPPTQTVKASDATHPVISFGGASDYVLAIQGWGLVSGLEFKSVTSSYSYLQLPNTYNGRTSFDNCLFDLTAATLAPNCPIQFYIAASTGNHNGFVFRHCEFKFNSSTGGFGIGPTSMLMEDCKVTQFTTSALSPLFYVENYSENGYRLDVKGLDVSTAMISTQSLIGTTNYYTKGWFRFTGVKTPIGMNLVKAGSHFAQGGYIPIVIFNQCGASGEYYNWQEHSGEGQVKTNTSIYRKATYDGHHGYFSVQMTANSNRVAPGIHPLRHELCKTYVDLTVPRTLTVHVTSPSVSLDNGDFWIEVDGYDPTNSGPHPQYTTRWNCFDAKQSLTTSSGAGWTGSSLHRQVSIEIPAFPQNSHFDKSLGGSSQATRVPLSIWVCYANISNSVYVCPYVEIT